MRPRIRKTIVVIHVIVPVSLLGEVWGPVVLNTAAALTKDLAPAHAAYRLMPLLVFAGGILALTTGVLPAPTRHCGITGWRPSASTAR